MADDDLSTTEPAAASDDGHAGAHEARLGSLDDYEVADGYPDIRGWAVRGSNGRELGTIGELLVDTELLEVAAVDIHLGVGAAGVRGNVIGSTRVPIESVQIRPDRYVIVDVGVIPCEDVLEAAPDGSGTVRRVPCGQIGIRKRDEASRAARAAAMSKEREVARPAEVADRMPAPPTEPRQGRNEVPGAAGAARRD